MQARLEDSPFCFTNFHVWWMEKFAMMIILKVFGDDKKEAQKWVDEFGLVKMYVLYSDIDCLGITPRKISLQVKRHLKHIQR